MSQDDPELPFTDEDYRKRRAHPNFKKHIDLEKLVVKMGKTVSPTSRSKRLLLEAFCPRWIRCPWSLSLVPEEEELLHVRGGVWTSVRDGRASLPPAVQGQGGSTSSLLHTASISSSASQSDYCSTFKPNLVHSEDLLIVF